MNKPFQFTDPSPAEQEATRRKAPVEYVLEGFESGALRPVIDHSFKFDEMREVHRYLENNGQFGKIVVTV